MKNLVTLCVLLAFALSLACCKKDAVDPASSGSVTFKVDSLTDLKSSVAGGVWEPTNSLLNITAKAGRAIIVMNLQMPAGLKTGTYNFSASSPAATGTFFRPDSTVINEGYYSNVDAKSFGTLIITGLTSDSLVTGTFTFTLKDPSSAKLKKISNGVITSVKVVNNKTLTSVGSNTFTTKIDGSAWTPNQISGISNAGTLQIVASDGSKSVALTMPSTVQAGTYTLGTFGATHTGTFIPSFSISNPLTYISGGTTSKLTITENNTTSKQIKGTFNFKADEFLGGPKSYQITEGSFVVKY